jgi:hypothetical protein
MFPQLNRDKAHFQKFRSKLGRVQPLLNNSWKMLGFLPQTNLLLAAALLISITPTHTAFAHKVKTSADVGAILHIEPNDQPRAGEKAKTWFALTQKGGKIIPLQDCNCQLAIYAQPHTPGEPALLEPPLKPVAAERYQGTPGTEITFPRPGIYQLQLSGKPVGQKKFQPFKFNFEVTVAAGSSVIDKPQNVENVKSNEIQDSPLPFPFWVFSIPLLTLAGILFFLQRGRKREK